MTRTISLGIVGRSPTNTLPGRAVERDPVALRDRRTVHAERVLLGVDRDVLASDHRALAHATRDHCGVTRHATASGKHGARGDNAVEVLGRGLLANEDHGVAFRVAPLGVVGIEHRLAARCAGARR